jgi:hypothetical protein
MTTLSLELSHPRLPSVRSPLSKVSHERLTSTVPREYVHRVAVSEVLLTSWAAVDADTYTARAQWPRGHSFFTTIGGRWQDPLLIAETIRQAGLLLAHAEFDVPLGHQFLLWDLSYSICAEAPAVSESPTELDLHISCHDIVRRGTRLSSMRYTVTLLRNDVPTAIGEARFSCTSPASYLRLRGSHSATSTAPVLPLPRAERPADVGRVLPHDVVLAPCDKAAPGRQLRVDPTHPILFDHPVDHVPGMVLLEAARQAATAAMRPRLLLPMGMASTFARYVELDTPCWITTDAGVPDQQGNVRVRITATQNNETAFTCSVAARVLG